MFFIGMTEILLSLENRSSSHPHKFQQEPNSCVRSWQADWVQKSSLLCEFALNFLPIRC